MNVLVRNMVLILFVWMMLAGVCLGKQVYLKDGSIIDGQSAWRRGNKVFVKVNRDIIADFNLSEIDMQRTFPKTARSIKKAKRSHHVRRKVAAHAATVVKASTKVPVKPVAAVAIPAPKPASSAADGGTSAPQPALPTTHIPLPVSTEPIPPPAATTTSAESAPPPDQAELDRRKQEAVKMMTEAVMKRDPELMKKAVEMQKSAMPQPGAEGLMKSGLPLSVQLVFLAVCLFFIVVHWIIFVRAGQGGWKSLIPFYNTYVFMEISGKPGWWMFLMLVPLVNIPIYFLAMFSLAGKFGRSGLFGLGVAILPFIFLPVLAFGSSQYEG